MPELYIQPFYSGTFEHERHPITLTPLFPATQQEPTHWQKPNATLLKPDEVYASDQFKLGFWLRIRGAVRLFISLGFWHDAFLSLFNQDWWTSFTAKSLIDDQSRFVCSTCIAIFNTAIEYEMHAIFYVDAFLTPSDQDSWSSHMITPILDDVAVTTKRLTTGDTASFGGYGTQLSGAHESRLSKFGNIRS